MAPRKSTAASANGTTKGSTRQRTSSTKSTDSAVAAKATKKASTKANGGARKSAAASKEPKEPKEPKEAKEPRKRRSSTASTASKAGKASSKKAAAATNGHASLTDDEEVAATKKAHKQIKKAQNTEYDHHYGHVDMRDEQIVGGGKERALIHYNPGIIISEKGREADKKLDQHYEYEFGGPWNVAAMISTFPFIMYYFWICLWFYDGQLVRPRGFDDIPAFLARMGHHVYQDAFPTPRAIAGYGGLMVFQFALAWFMPGYMQEGLPVPSLNYKTLMYRCNALSCFYATLVVSAILHLSGLYRLTTIIEHFGEYMTVAIIVGFVVSFITYYHAVWTNTAHRMSGNFIYDFWMGAALNPRIGPVDLKMWLEVRIPWVLLFLISVSGACKQYEDYGYVTPNMALMVLGTGLYINACGKGEECIPQTWDMFHEKWGFMIIFWNFAGVPFTYCYSVVYMATHPPHYYRFTTVGNIIMFATLIIAHWIFDSSMAQKSRFRMQLQGTYRIRYTFPQWPWSVLEDPRYLQTEHGNALLIDGWWQYLRKPNYSADWTQSFLWGFCAGFNSVIPYYYCIFFLTVLTHRCGRDFERCERKYKQDWVKYCKIVPYRFIPFVY